MISELNVPHIDQYFGPWAIMEEPFRAAVERINALDIRANVEARHTAGGVSLDTSYEKLPGGVAVVSLSGPLMKYVSSLSGGTSTVEARAALRAAVKDDSVSSIVVRIDSPGGTVSGTQDLAADVAAANTKKPTVAFIEDLGASAAYWIASQAGNVFANTTAMIGCIGTFAAIEDASQASAQAGIKVHVVRAGEFKGMGVEGTEVTPKQLEELQRIVNELNDYFIRGVATGRGMSLSQVKALADGRVHVGAKAQEQGLIDGVKSLDQVIAELAAKSKTTKGSAMSSESTAANPATFSEIVGACKNCKPTSSADDALFVADQLAKGATVAQARDAWDDTLTSRIDARDCELNAAKVELAKKQTQQQASLVNGNGVKPLVDGGKGGSVAEESSDPIAAWNEAVAEKMKAGKSKASAISALVKENPDLHQSYLAAFNENSKRKVG